MRRKWEDGRSLSGALSAVEGRIAATQRIVAEMQPRASRNALPERELRQYRAAKRSLYLLQCERNRLRQRRNNGGCQIDEEDVSL